MLNVKHYQKQNIQLLKIERRGKHFIEFFFVNGERSCAYGRRVASAYQAMKPLITADTQQIAIW